MKIKLDENIPASIAGALNALGNDVDTVKDENLIGAPDSIIWESAQREGRFLITQDLDFSDIRKFSPGTHYGILLVRLWVPGRSSLLLRIAAIFKQEKAETWKGCFVVLTDSKLRVIRPAGQARKS
jgi:predicted nuclease of predicted toxin-antitoxin system